MLTGWKHTHTWLLVVQMAAPGRALACLQSSESSLFRGPVWTQKQVVSLSSVHWKDKGGTVGVAAVTSVPTRWQIHAGKSSFRRWERSRELLWALITVVWRSCESLSVSLRIKTRTSSCSEPPEDISRSAISHRERNVVKSHNTLIDKHLGPLYELNVNHCK